MLAVLSVNVAATGPAAPWIASSVAMSMPLSVARRVNPVPALIVGNWPESTMATPKINPPLVEVDAAVLVTLLAAVVAFPVFFAVTSSGDVVAAPLYSLAMMRR